MSKIAGRIDFTDEVKDKIRKAITGKRHTPETIEKLRLAKLGKKRQPHSPETIIKMRESAGKRIMPPMSEETKRKLSEVKKGIPKPPRSKEHSEVISLAHKKAYRDGSNPLNKFNERRRLEKEKKSNSSAQT